MRLGRIRKLAMISQHELPRKADVKFSRLHCAGSGRPKPSVDEHERSEGAIRPRRAKVPETPAGKARILDFRTFRRGRTCASADGRGRRESKKRSAIAFGGRCGYAGGQSESVTIEQRRRFQPTESTRQRRSDHGPGEGAKPVDHNQWALTIQQPLWNRG